MSRRIVLGIIIILVLSIILAIAGFILFSMQPTQEDQVAQTSALPNPALDPSADVDNDGLTNGEERTWGTDINNSDTDSDGYSDGKEVSANHNPLLKGPNDKLQSSPSPSATTPDPFFSNALDLTGGNKNLTQEYAKQVPDKDKTPVTLSQFISAQPIITQIPSVNEAAIPKEQDSKLSLSQYISAAGDISTITDKTRVSLAVTDFLNDKNVTGFNTLADRVDYYEHQLKALRVPPEGIEYHKLLLGYSKLMEVTFKQIGDYSNDQIKALVALRQLDAIDRQYYPLILKERARLINLSQQP